MRSTSHFSPQRNYPHALHVGILSIVAISSACIADEPLIAIPVPAISFSLSDEPLPEDLLLSELHSEAPHLTPEPSLFPETAANDPALFESSPPESDTNSRILQLAIKVAPSVVSIRVWDEFGAELASGVGVLVSPSGIILTDAELLHPSLIADIDYITVRTGVGANFCVEEIIHHDLVSGIALLGVNASDLPYLKLDPTYDFSDHPDVTMVALHPSEGLSLNDATVVAGSTPATRDWLELSGTDSPGAIGSPIFSEDGHVIGLVALHVPLTKWVNFALPIDSAASSLAGGSRRGAQSLDAFRRTDYPTVRRDSKFLAAWEKMRAAQYRGAAVAFLDLTRRFPREASCWALLALASHENGDNSEAAACARMAVALNPTIGFHWKNFAALAPSNDDATSADSSVLRDSLEAATEGLPRDWRSWLALAEVYVRALQFETAERALRQVVSLHADSGEALYLLAYSQGKLGKYQQAQLTIERSVRIRPRHTESWYLMGLLYTETHQPEFAAEAFEKVVTLNPNHPHAWINLSRAWNAAGNSTKALLAFRKYQDIAR